MVTAISHLFAITVPPDTVPVRIDIFLAHHLKNYSRSFFQRMIAENGIHLNGHLVVKPSIIIRSHDQLNLSFAPAVPLYKDQASFAEKKPIKLVFEHEHFFIINKPAGWMVHAPHNRCQEATVVDWLVHSYQDLKTVGNHERPGIVHRLDKDTSGLLIIARTNYAHMVFTGLFKQRALKKTYLAIVAGHPAYSQGTLEFPIARDPKNRTKMSTSVHNITRTKSRAALTEYRVVEYFKETTLLELVLITGRTHQIRVHCAAMGHPIIGDQLYGKKSPLITRQALHAHKLSFVFDNQEYHFCSDLPEDFNNLILCKRA